MKQCLILALVATLAAASISIGTDTAYIPGKEYVYKYETMTNTALRTANNQVTGLKIMTTVRMQIDGQMIITAKLESPELCKVNQEVPRTETVETVMEHSCTPLTGPEAEIIIEELIKPFSFRLESGIPTELRIDGEEPYWSVNIKRGLLNVLQLNLKERDVIETLSPEIMDVVMSNIPYGSGELHKVFRAYEDDLVGKCETIYTVMEDDIIPNNIHVSKVRNYENCKTKPIFRTGLMTAFKDIYPDFEKHTTIKSLSHADYMLTGNRHEYIITLANLKSHYTVQPFGAQNVESAYTCTSQKLILLDILPTPSQIRMTSRQETVPPLKMFIPIHVSSYYDSEPIYKIEHIRAQIDTIHSMLDEVVGMVVPIVHEEVPKKVAQIALIMRRVPITDLNELINTIINVPLTDDIAIKKKELILDILPTLTRPDLVEIIKELVTRDIISPPRAAIMINMMVLTVKPSPKTFEDIMVLLRDPIMGRSPTLRRAVLLSAGILANKIKTMFIEMHIDTSITVPELHKISQELVSLLQSTTILKEKIEVMGVLGNAGLIELIPEIEIIIKNREAPSILRAKAVYALRKIAKFAPKKVTNILLPLFLKPTVPRPVRIAAFLITMKTMPSTGIMQFITHGLKKETSMEVVSFVHSYLETLSESTDPKVYNMSTKAKLALREIKPIKPGFVHSRVFNMEKYIKSMGPLGADIKLQLINSGYSPVPDNIIAKIATSILGKKIDIAEFGIETEGLKSLLWNIIGPVNRRTDFVEGTATLEDFLLPLSELASKIIGSVDNIRNRFNTVERGVIREKILHVYMKLLDYELATVFLEEHEILELIREVKSVIPEILSTLQSGYNVRTLKTLSVLDAAVVIPTPCGLPLSINASAIAVLGIHGDVRLQGLNSIFELFGTSSRPVVSLFTDLIPSTATSVVFTMGTQLAFFKTKAKAKIAIVGAVPVKSEIEINLVEKKVKISIEPPQSEMKLIHIKVTPKTTFEKMLINPSTPTYDIEEVIVTSTPLQQYMSEVVGIGIGMPVKYRYEMSPAFSILIPKTYLIAPVYAEVIFEASRGVPSKYELEFKYFGINEAVYTVSSGSEEGMFRSWWPSSSQSASSSYRTASRNIAGLNFDPITPEAGVEMNTKREIMAIFRTIGGSIQKEAKLKIAHLCDPTWLKQQINIQIISTPLVVEYTTPIKVVMDTVLVVPEFILHFVPNPTTYMNTEMLLKMEIKHGFSNTVERLAYIQTFFKRLTGISPEYSSTTAGIETMTPYTLTMHVPHPYRNSSAMQGLINATIGRNIFYESRRKIPLMLLTEVDYEYSMVPELVKWLLPSVHQMILKVPTIVSEKAIVGVMPAWNEMNKIKLETILDPLTEKIKMVLMLPSMNNTIMGLPLPMPYLFEKTIHTPALPAINTMIMHGDIPTGWCAITPDNYVHAYDLMSVHMPETMCEVVVAKDCSALNLFMVTAKKMSGTGKIVKIYLPGKEVEIIPAGMGGSSWSSGAGIEVRIDGQVIPVSVGNPHVIIDPTTGKELLKVIKKDTSVLISSWIYGIVAETDGSFVYVKTSEMYRGQVCGVCGDYNSDMFNELRGPQNELYWSRLPFLTSYMIAGEGCDVSSIPRYPSNIPRYPSNSYYSPQSRTRSCEKFYRNVVVERNINGEQKICFSQEPVPHCPRSCVAREIIQRSKPFVCKPAYRQEAQQLREEVQHRPITLRTEPVQLHDLISEPQRCEPMY